MSETKYLDIIPELGRGLVTGLSPFNLGDDSRAFDGYRDVIVRNGTWRARFINAATTFSGSSDAVWGTHIFNSRDVSASSPTPVSVILGVTGPSGGTVKVRYMDGASNGDVLTVSSPYEVEFVTAKNRCFIGGLNVTPTIFTKFPSRTSYSWGKAGPTGDLSYDAFIDATNTAQKIFYKAADAAAGGGTNILGSATNAFDNSGAWDGKTLQLNHDVFYKIDTVIAVNTLHTTTNIPATGGNKDFKVFYGNLTWTDTGPQYAYAYYAPSTGHITNVSPILQITEKNISNVNINLQGIVGTNDPIYTRIVIFRTAQDGGDLLPLKLDPTHGGSATVNASDFMIENTYVGSKSYRDGQPDAKLGQILGGLPYPHLNNPPPASIKFLSYWDGRFWFVDPTRPWEIGFTGSPTQNPLGVAEECFPAGNRLQVSTDDGAVTSSHVVGGALLVGSDKYLYQVTGTSEADYRLVRVSSKALAVGHWAIDEHPGDSTTDTASAIYIGQDRRMWRHYPGGRFEDIGAQIQDKLDATPLDASRPFFVRVAQVDKNWLCALGFINPTKTKYSFYFYDFDSKQWYDWGFDQTEQPGWSISFGVYYPAVAGTLIWGGTTNAQLNVLNNSLGISIGTNAAIKTKPLDMGDRTMKKTLQRVILFVDDASKSFAVKVAVDGSDAAAGTSLVLADHANTPAYPGANIMDFVPTSSSGLKGSQWHAIQVRAAIPSAGDNFFHHIAKMRVVYTLESTGDLGGQP